MALTLVFIGYNEEQTRRYFKEFIEINKDHVQDYPLTRNTATSWVCPTSVRMKDGTLIRRAPNSLTGMSGLRFDQVIVAADRRGTAGWTAHRQEMLWELGVRRSRWLVDDEFGFIYYDLDSEEGNPYGQT